MNNVTKFVLLLLLLPIVLVSCDPATQFKSEIAQVDSCLVEVDSLEKLFDGIEFDSLVLMVEHVNRNEASIKALYKADTLNEDLGRQMNDCKSIRKSLANVEKDKGVYGDEINAIKHQLLDLKEDITNGKFGSDQIKDYLSVEKAALSKLSFAFGSFNTMQLKEKNRYYIVVPKVDELVKLLKTKNENTE